MDSTYLNIIVFVAVSLVYFLMFKPKLKTEALEKGNETLLADFNKNSYFRLSIYFIFVILLQFFVNVSALVNSCGGSVTQNLGVASFLTFIPWILFFGILIVVLIIYPGFKSAFSDVIGYFFVYGHANKVLSDLLIEPEVQHKIDKMGKKGGAPMDMDMDITKKDAEPIMATAVPGPISVEASALQEPENIDTKSSSSSEKKTPSSSYTEKGTSSLSKDTPKNTSKSSTNTSKYPSSTTNLSKTQYQDVADAIVKLTGNKSILINQIVQSNFEQYWNILTPLMRPQYQSAGGSFKIKQELLDIVVARDSIGEGMWYGYTAILLITIIQYYIVSRGCVKGIQQMQNDYQQFLSEEDTAQQKAQTAQTTYTLGP
jgi:hypothetical protein